MTYKTYRLYDGDTVLGEFAISQIARIINRSERRTREICVSGELCDGRYRAEYVGKKKSESQKWTAKPIKPKEGYRMSLEEARNILDKFGNVACTSGKEYFEELSKGRNLVIKVFDERWSVIREIH